MIISMYAYHVKLLDKSFTHFENIFLLVKPKLEPLKTKTDKSKIDNKYFIDLVIDLAYSNIENQ